MEFLLAGVNYADAPLETLERVAIKGDELASHVKALTQRVGGEGTAAIISTCNRTELYAVADNPASALDEMTAYMLTLARRGSETNGDAKADQNVSPYVGTMTGYDAVHHLCRVVTGLDSLVTGDHQVAGQVTRSFRALADTGIPVHPRLSRMFHVAFRAGRKARRESGLGWAQVSIPTFGVQLLEREIGDLSGQSALLVGAGETGRLTAMALMRAGVSEMRIASRSTERAEGLAAEIGGVSIDLRDVATAMSDADIVVTCTAADAPVITESDVRRATENRTDQVIHLLDLGLPRDIDPNSASVGGANLYTLDNLLDLQAEHRKTVAEASEKAEAIVAEAAADFIADIEVQPALKALGERAEAVRTQELQRTIGRMPHLSDSDREKLDAMTRSIVKQLLSEPIQQIRSSNR